MQQKIWVYTMTYNNAKMMEFFLDHYRFAEEIVLLDDGSNDGTVDIAKVWAARNPDASLTIKDIRHTTSSLLDDEVHSGIKNTCWTDAVGRADWVIVVDQDEYLHHLDLDNYLTKCKAAGITIPRTTAYEMVSAEFPQGTGYLIGQVSRGVRNDLYSKCVIFDPNKVKAINYGVGSHECYPTGDVKYDGMSSQYAPVRGYAPMVLQRSITPPCELSLLHYRFLGLNHIRETWSTIQQRLSPNNRAKGWARHCYLPPVEQQRLWSLLMAEAQPVVMATKSEATPVAPAAPQPPKLPQVIYTLTHAGRCGGVRVVLEHVTRLCKRGFDAKVFFVYGDLNWFDKPVPNHRFESAQAMQRALTDNRGIKVATWYETAPLVRNSLRENDRGYYLVQDIETSYANSPAQAAEVLRSYNLGLTCITEGKWVEETLTQKVNQKSVFVSIGVDFDTFYPDRVYRDTQSILTQYRTWSGGAGAAGLRLKNWPLARDVAVECLRCNGMVKAITFSVEAKPELSADIEARHTHYAEPSDEELAKLYRGSGLYLMTSNHEGFCLPAAEAMACLCPVVATYADGNHEFCIDGVTALMADQGDKNKLVLHCQAIHNDTEMAKELAYRAYNNIEQYTWNRVIDQLEAEYKQTPRQPIVLSTPPAPVTGDPPPPVPQPEPKLPALAVSLPIEYPDLRLDGEPSCDWSVIIPTVNNLDDVLRCISSCRANKAADETMEFIVVDDGTKDRELRRKLSNASYDYKFELRCNNQNLGYSASVNAGMFACHGKYLALVNNDVAFTDLWTDDVIHMLGDGRIGVAGMRLLYPDCTIQHGGVAKVPNELSFYHTGQHKPGDTKEFITNRLCIAVTGAVFVIRRSVAQKLGGYSNAYCNAWEDMDYCFHAWTHGVYVGYCGTVSASHYESKTKGATVEEKKKRPFLWYARERAGADTFKEKWGHFTNVTSYEQLLPKGT